MNLIFFNDLDDSVISMHTNNGLIHDCTHAGMSVQQAERKLTDYMKQANDFIDVLYPAGFSGSFDKAFINREMPAVLSNVQHRMVDLTESAAHAPAFKHGVKRQDNK